MREIGRAIGRVGALARLRLNALLAPLTGVKGLDRISTVWLVAVSLMSPAWAWREQMHLIVAVWPTIMAAFALKWYEPWMFGRVWVRCGVVWLALCALRAAFGQYGWVFFDPAGYGLLLALGIYGLFQPFHTRLSLTLLACFSALGLLMGQPLLFIGGATLFALRTFMLAMSVIADSRRRCHGRYF
jgi:hypothetical protein